MSLRGRLSNTATVAALVAGVFTAGCANPPGRLVRGAGSPDVEVRRNSVVRLRAYSSGNTRSRERTRDLLITALEDTDAEVRRLAALGLIEYKRNEEAHQAVSTALARSETPAERAQLSDVLSRFR